MVAIEVPEVSRPPPGGCGKFTSSAIQRTTARSRWTSAWSPPAELGFIAEAARVASTPAGAGAALTQPKNLGCPLPIGAGITSAPITFSSSASGRPSAGSGASSSAWRAAGSIGCQTGRSGTASR